MRVHTALVVFALLLLPQAGRAAVLTYDFAGTITEAHNLPGLAIGQSFTGSFTYDTSASDTFPFPEFGVYPQTGSITFDFNAGTLVDSAALGEILTEYSSTPSFYRWLGRTTLTPGFTGSPYPV